MNQRIQQLAEQAGFIDFIVFNRIESKEQVIEKFAQLIVQECIDIAKNRENELESAKLVKESNAVGIVAYRIARQFGVEE